MPLPLEQPIFFMQSNGPPYKIQLLDGGYMELSPIEPSDVAKDIAKHYPITVEEAMSLWHELGNWQKVIERISSFYSV